MFKQDRQLFYLIPFLLLGLGGLVAASSIQNPLFSDLLTIGSFALIIVGVAAIGLIFKFGGNAAGSHANAIIPGLQFDPDLYYVKGSKDDSVPIPGEPDRFETTLYLSHGNFYEPDIFPEIEAPVDRVYVRHWLTWSERVHLHKGVALYAGVPIEHFQSEDLVLYPLGLKEFGNKERYPVFELVLTKEADYPLLAVAMDAAFRKLSAMRKMEAKVRYAQARNVQVEACEYCQTPLYGRDPVSEIPGYGRCPYCDVISPLETPESKSPPSLAVLTATSVEVLAYCTSCRKKTRMADVEATVTRRGNEAAKGKCSVCGSSVYRMGPLPGVEVARAG
jgi:hypothetical protein